MIVFTLTISLPQLINIQSVERIVVRLVVSVPRFNGFKLLSSEHPSSPVRINQLSNQELKIQSQAIVFETTYLTNLWLNKREIKGK